jgi:hypothetical protein
VVLAIAAGCTQSARTRANVPVVTATVQSTTAASVSVTPDVAVPTVPTAPVTSSSVPTTVAKVWMALPARVAFFSDSLGYEARDFVSQELDRRFGTEVSFVYVGGPGAALCDYRDTIVAAIERRTFDVIAMEFSGNGFTECAKGPGGGFLEHEALLSRYRFDAEAVASAADHEPVVLIWVGAPSPWIVGPDTDVRNAMIESVYRPLADKHRNTISYAHLAVYSEMGMPVRSKSCLAEDETCTDGYVVVRSPDGVHFCPAPESNPSKPCPVWSSGAYRYGAAIAASISGLYGR